MTTKRPVFWLTAVVLVALMPACQSQRAQLPVAPWVGPMPSRELTVSQAQLQQVAGEAYARLIAQAATDGVLDNDAASTTRVRAIVRRLIAASGALNPEAPGWPWEIHVLDQTPLDTWCLPGGKVAVHTPLLTGLRLDDDETAALLAHAMAHILRGHSLERAQAEAPGDLDPLAFGSVARKPYSRAHESEADRLGIELAARAGYSPLAAAGLWRKATALVRTGVEVRWLEVHPWTASRQEDIDAVARRVMPLYEQAKRP
jgi:Zn-dependent protease with chaperone function